MLGSMASPLASTNVARELMVFAVLLPLPALDEIVGGRQFEKLCKENSTIQVNRATAVGRTVYSTQQPSVEIKGTWVRITLQPWRYVDATTGEWTATPVTRPLASMSVAMTQDGRHLAMVSGPTLTRLDVTTGAVEQRELASAVTSWSPDRSALAVLDATTGSGSARVLVFDPWSDSAPSVAATLPGPQAQADASGTDGPCIQWLPEVPR